MDWRDWGERGRNGRNASANNGEAVTDGQYCKLVVGIGDTTET